MAFVPRIIAAVDYLSVTTLSQMCAPRVMCYAQAFGTNGCEKKKKHDPSHSL